MRCDQFSPRHWCCDHEVCVHTCTRPRARTFVFLCVWAALYLFSTGSRLLCTPLCSGDKMLFHSPSTKPYQSANRNPDCSSLRKLNARRLRDRAAFQELHILQDPPSQLHSKLVYYCNCYYQIAFFTNNLSAQQRTGSKYR